jgi:DNA-binding CsgD family transcriptional regulator
MMTTPAARRPAEALTSREREILNLVAGGLTSPRIATHLGISVPTVRTHVAHIRTKLGAHTRAEAVARAVSLGWLGR